MVPEMVDYTLNWYWNIALISLFLFTNSDYMDGYL
jgi:hypothetical protein